MKLVLDFLMGMMLVILLVLDFLMMMLAMMKDMLPIQALHDTNAPELGMREL